MFLGIKHQGIRTESASATFRLNATITGPEHVGKPVSVDPAQDFLVGLAADGAEVIGYLESYEDRVTEGEKVGAVNWHICTVFSYTGVAPTRGGSIVGAGAGNVKAAGAGEGKNTLVTAVDAANQLVSVTFR